MLRSNGRAGSVAALLACCLFAGCAGAPTAPTGSPVERPAGPGPDLMALSFLDLTGTVPPFTQGPGDTMFNVTLPPSATWAGATLHWQTRGAVVNLTVLGPEGRPRGEQRTLPRTYGPARTDWWTADPAPGNWTFVVHARLPRAEPVRLQIHTLNETMRGMHVAENTSVAANRFVEVNFRMAKGQSLAFDWTSGSPLAYDVHAHRGAATVYLVQFNGTAQNGTFTADQDDLFSLLWETPQGAAGPGADQLPGGPAVPLLYRADGDFALDSASG